ncbi:hypothetical protein BKA62DRAFT_688668 [Auriculariales sp. MPI-PUGE-AT-0066]|nr:hypothetical protein BKA62DRAFT_688668 [Auriculariales sp. MPI-PUGE-AT-0066]
MLASARIPEPIFSRGQKRFVPPFFAPRASSRRTCRLNFFRATTLRPAPQLQPTASPRAPIPKQWAWSKVDWSTVKLNRGLTAEVPVAGSSKTPAISSGWVFSKTKEQLRTVGSGLEHPPPPPGLYLPLDAIRQGVPPPFLWSPGLPFSQFLPRPPGWLIDAALHFGPGSAKTPGATAAASASLAFPRGTDPESSAAAANRGTGNKFHTTPTSKLNHSTTDSAARDRDSPDSDTDGEAGPPWKCKFPGCETVFRRRYELDRHKPVHEADGGKITCGICGSRFRGGRKDALRRHQLDARKCRSKQNRAMKNDPDELKNAMIVTEKEQDLREKKKLIRAAERDFD